MSDDLIRRSDAIRVTEPYKNNIDIIPTAQARLYVREAVEGIRKELLKLPTIEPKRGEWIEINIKDYKALCSCCGVWSPVMGNFCPNCGADMRGAENE